MTKDATNDDDVGSFSIWFMRGAVVATTLVVLFFLVQATVGFFDGDDEPTSTDDGQVEVADERADDAGTDTDDDAEADGEDTETEDTDDPEGESDDSEPLTAEEVELQAFVDEAIAFIENLRERAFVERPRVEVVSVDEMTRIVLDDIEADLAEDPEAADASLAFARAIGFFEPTQEFLDVYEIFVSGGVLGVYFPHTDQLLVRSAGELTLSTKATIVHELVHAFDDQHFDLDRDELSQDGDAGWAFIAAVEGSASWVENAWRDTLSPEQAAALQAEELAFDLGDVFSLDFGFLVYQTSVYEGGRTWLDRRIAAEGVAAIDDALINGAPTSEAVVEPLDADGLDPIDVPSPAVDGEVLWEGRGGHALISALTILTDPSQVGATGWGGDAMTVYLDAGGNECLRWDLVGDSDQDTAEIFDALQTWVTGVGGSADMVDDRVRIDRCA